MRRLPPWFAIRIRYGGGTLNNKVVYHAMKALNDPERGLGWPVLRFNFRGMGLSRASTTARPKPAMCSRLSIGLRTNIVARLWWLVSVLAR